MDHSGALRKLGAGAVLAAGILVAGTSAPARIKLVALPERESISLSVEHPSANLVQEERTLTLQKGVNQVDFNWQGVAINADAIVLEPLEHPDEIKLIAVRYPPGENALVWDVFSPRAMTERIRVTYFLEGIGREYAYRAIADTGEENLSLKQAIRLRNDSGERLEKVKVYTGLADAYVTDLDAGEIRQTQVMAVQTPFTRLFTWDAAEKPHDPSKAGATVGIPITYVVTNDAEHKLGSAPLRGGKARIFQDDGKGSNAFIGEDWSAYTPVTEKLKLSVGESRDLKVTRKQKEITRTSERRNGSYVVLYDQREEYEVTVENFRKKDATLTLIDHFDQTWDVKAASMPWTREDFRTLKIDVPVAAADSVVVTYTIERRNLRPSGVLQ